MELGLSKQEWVVLQYVTFTWTCYQCWDTFVDLYDRYNKRVSRNRESTASTRQ